MHIFWNPKRWNIPNDLHNCQGSKKLDIWDLLNKQESHLSISLGKVENWMEGSPLILLKNLNDSELYINV